MTNNSMSGQEREALQYFTVVYKGVVPGDEARIIGGHPKAVAMGWSHAFNERDALAALLRTRCAPPGEPC